MNILHIRLINLILVSGDLCRLCLLCHHFYSCHKTVIVFLNHLSLVDQGTHKYVGRSFSVLRVNTNLPRHFLIRKREREPGYEVVIVHART